MREILNYQIQEPIGENQIYRAYSKERGCSVLLKLNEHNGEFDSLQQEYELLSQLKMVEGIVQVYAYHKHEDFSILVLEDLGGSSLQKILEKNQGLDFSLFFPLAIAMTRTLNAIHEHHWIHQGVKSENWMWNGSMLKLVDFGEAHMVSRETPRVKVKHTQATEKSISYLSPEQTGLVHRFVDYRTDYYSLGVVFYELLTGGLPFQSVDQVKLIHSHLAQHPLLPHYVNDTIPSILSQLTLKLMAKSVEDRYQSSSALEQDLQHCWDQWQKNKKISPFELAQKDVSHLFHLSTKLHGREEKMERLLNLYRRIQQGERGIALISGSSGVGKSHLIREVQKRIVQEQGDCLVGKFEQYKSNLPYFGWTEAFRNWIQKVLSLPQSKIEDWQKKIFEALGNHGQILIELLPEMETILGEQPPLPDLFPEAAESRFHWGVYQFLSCISSSESPLALFLDDLQWADSSSLKLLEYLTRSEITWDSSAPASFLIIGGYRNHKLSPKHPLASTLEKIEDSAIIKKKIHIQSLNAKGVGQFLADSFSTSLERVEPLAELCHQKTAGNPFFLNQFLQTLYREQFLNFDFSQAQWTWDLEKIQQSNFTDNVLDMMVERIQQLPLDTQETLQVAACLGKSFPLSSLSWVQQELEEETEEHLKAAFSAKLLARSGAKIYHFLHNRIQQAAYSMLEESHRAEIHWKIGWWLENREKVEVEEMIFEIVDHLNRGKEKARSIEDCIQLVEWNYKAGNKAKSSAAYDLALIYFKTGLNLLPSNSWTHYYPLSLALTTKSAELAYLTGNFEKLQSLSQWGIRKAKNILDQIPFYELQIDVFKALDKNLEAIQMGVKVLSQLKILLPTTPKDSYVEEERKRIEKELKFKSLESLFSMPKMKDPIALAAMNILSSLTAVTDDSIHQMAPLLTYQQIDLTLNYGNAPLSADVYADYGRFLLYRGQFQEGCTWIQMGRELIEHLEAKELRGRLRYARAFTLWITPLPQLQNEMLQAYQENLEEGDFEHAATSLNAHIQFSLFQGTTLPSLQKTLLEHRQKVSSLKQEFCLFTLTLYDLFISYLQKGNQSESFDENNFVEDLIKKNDYGNLRLFYLFKQILAYFFYRFEEALFYIEKRKEYGDFPPAIPFAQAHFYDSLTYLAVKEATPIQLEQVKKNIQAMGEFAKLQPHNFKHQFYFLKAEYFRFLGEKEEVAQAYTDAIDLAYQNGFLYEEALAKERAAHFYLQLKNRRETAKMYLMEALEDYQKWGAAFKLKAFLEKFPFLSSTFGKENDLQQTLLTELEETFTINLVFMIENSTSLSLNQRKPFLNAFLQVVLQSKGAQRGILLVPPKKNTKIMEEGTWKIEAEEVLNSLEEEKDQRSEPSLELINYIINTRQAIALDHASRDERFSNAPDVKYSKSILGLPLFFQGEFIAILYLENNLVTGAFPFQESKVILTDSFHFKQALEEHELDSEEIFEHFGWTNLLQEKDRKIVFEVYPDPQKIVERSHD